MDWHLRCVLLMDNILSIGIFRRVERDLFETLKGPPHSFSPLSSFATRSARSSFASFAALAAFAVRIAAVTTLSVATLSVATFSVAALSIVVSLSAAVVSFATAVVTLSAAAATVVRWGVWDEVIGRTGVAPRGPYGVASRTDVHDVCTGRVVTG